MPPTTTATTAPGPFNFASGEDDEGYQVINKKRMRGRPTSAAAAQHQALRDPQQTRISFEPTVVRLANPVVTDVSNTAPLPQAAESATELTLAISTTSMTTTTPIPDDEDIVMDAIPVRENED